MKAAEIDDRTYEEVNRLYNLFRTSSLNVKYYGCRAEMYELRERNLSLGVAALSAVALVVLLATGAEWARYMCAALAGTATLLTAVQPFLGWKERAREMNFLHRAHNQLFTQIESLLSRVRRSGLITGELIGASAECIESFERLQALDEAHPDKQLIDRLNEDVQAAFPPDYVWTGF